MKEFIEQTNVTASVSQSNGIFIDSSLFIELVIVLFIVGIIIYKKRIAFREYILGLNFFQVEGNIDQDNSLNTSLTEDQQIKLLTTEQLETINKLNHFFATTQYKIYNLNLDEENKIYLPKIFKDYLHLEQYFIENKHEMFVETHQERMKLTLKSIVKKSDKDKLDTILVELQNNLLTLKRLPDIPSSSTVVSNVSTNSNSELSKSDVQQESLKEFDEFSDEKNNLELNAPIITTTSAPASAPNLNNQDQETKNNTTGNNKQSRKKTTK